MPSTTSELPEWEQVLTSAAHLQSILPGAVLVGGTAAAIYAGHRLSSDADRVLTNLRERFNEVLAELESVAGWKTARIRPPVQIWGSLDGIETGVRQLIRDQPLKTMEIERFGQKLTVPTPAEMLRIKAVLIVKRNASRDYLDFAALFKQIGDERATAALRTFDVLYPQPNGESALQQLQIQLASPMPFDLGEVNLTEYKHLAPIWRDWASVRSECGKCAILIFDRVFDSRDKEDR
jgi:Nucleotidyl transferase AbiEii toxin, Type IV TA system